MDGSGNGWRSIVCATDLSTAADQALQAAVTLARRDGARLVVFHALQMPIVPSASPLAEMPPLALAPLDVLETRARESLSEKLAGALVSIPGAPISSEVVVKIVTRPTYAAIVDEAEERGADLIVVGSRGHSAVERVLLGSVAEKVTRFAHCPVLVTRPSPASNRVIAGTDLSDPAVPAIRAAASEATRRGAELYVVHCLDLRDEKTAIETAEAQAARAELRRIAEERLASALAAVGAQAAARVLDPTAALALTHIAAELPAELIVVGHKGKTGLRRMLLGSTAETVVRQAPCSVLVVRLHPGH